MKTFYLPLIVLSLFAVSCEEAENNEAPSEAAEEQPTVESIEPNEVETETIVASAEFELVKPDTAALKTTYPKGDISFSMGYHYLTQAYSITSEKDSVEYYGDSKEFICHFYQTFEHGITYWKSNCSEEGGAQERITFPSLTNEQAKEFVNTLFYEPWNTWTTDLKYEADGAGCYYTIIQEDDQTIIDIWCGC